MRPIPGRHRLEVAPTVGTAGRRFDIVRVASLRQNRRGGLCLALPQFLLLVIPGLILLARRLFWAPVVIDGGLEKKEAGLVRRWPRVRGPRSSGTLFLVLGGSDDAGVVEPWWASIRCQRRG